MKLKDLMITENIMDASGQSVIFNFDNSEFDILEDMAFDVTNLVIASENNRSEIRDAGRIKLNLTPEKFAQRLVDLSPQMVSEVNDISFEGIHNFECTSDCTKTRSLPANFELGVTYTTNDGEQKTGTINFRGVSFSPSDEFLSKYGDLTSGGQSGNMEKP